MKRSACSPDVAHHAQELAPRQKQNRRNSSSVERDDAEVQSPTRIVKKLTPKSNQLVVEYIFTAADRRSAPEFCKGNFAKDFLNPISVAFFIDIFYRKGVFVTHGGGVQRIERLIAEHLYDLDLLRLMENTPSPHIFVWMRNQTDNKIESFELDDPKAALSCYNAGASLYFRAPQAMADEVVADLTINLGLNFGGYFPTGELKGEIETFVSKKGHVTDWHFDFQENFTIQLRVLTTPHYKAGQVIEQQLKVHVMQHPNFKYQPDDFSTVEEVVLREGDCFYHPAGLWHRVECEEDSISINVSLISATWSDVILDGLKQLMWRDADFRSGIQFSSRTEARSQLTQRLERMQSFVAQLRVEDLLPNSVFYPRHTRIHVPWPYPDRVPALSKQIRFNPLAVLLRTDHLPILAAEEESDDVEENAATEELPSDENEEGKQPEPTFSLHISFGNEDLQSQVQVLFTISLELLEIWESICRVMNSSPGKAISVSVITHQLTNVHIGEFHKKLATSLVILQSQGALSVE